MWNCPKCGVQLPDAVASCPDDGASIAPRVSAGGTPSFVGATIEGRYRIERKLGEGAMGEVYAARHLLIDKMVAIKKLSANVEKDSTSAQRFMLEARSVSRIRHPNVIDITDFGTFPDGTPCFVMEFLSGRTLGDLIEKESPLPDERIARIAAQVGRGLAAAHAQGIVHRDLKPDNVFLIEQEGEERVKVVDFGIAKVDNPDDDSPRLTQAGMVLGTVEYMAPEQARGKAMDHRIDQYALGCVIYEMLTGQLPYRGQSATETMTMHAFASLVPPSSRCPTRTISQALETICLRAMSKEPDLRFPGMSELVEALEQALGEISTGRDAERSAQRAQSALMSTQAVAPISTRQGGGKVVLLAAGVTIVLLVGGVGAWVVLGQRSRAPDPVAAAVDLGRPLVIVPPPTAPPDAAVDDEIRIRLESAPPGAEVLLGGTAVGVTPMVQRAHASDRPITFTFHLRGHRRATRQIVPNQHQTIDVLLERQRSSESPARALPKLPPQGPAELRQPW